MELVKKFSPDCPFSSLSTQCGIVYNNQHGGQFSISSVTLLQPSQHVIKISELYKSNVGSEEQKKKCQNLIERYSLTKRSFPFGKQPTNKIQH